ANPVSSEQFGLFDVGLAIGDHGAAATAAFTFDTDAIDAETAGRIDRAFVCRIAERSGPRPPARTHTAADAVTSPVPRPVAAQTVAQSAALPAAATASAPRVA